MKTIILTGIAVLTAAAAGATEAARPRNGSDFLDGIVDGFYAGAGIVRDGRRRAEQVMASRDTTPEKITGVEAGAEVRPEEVQRALARATAFLLARQNKDGGWGVGSGAQADPPYIQAAVTAYAVEALKLSGSKEAAAAIERGEAFIDANGGSEGEKEQGRSFPGKTQQIYALAMGLTNTVRREASEESHARAEGYAKRLGEILGAGSGGYYGSAVQPSSFQLAMVAEALREADEAGVAVPEGLLERVYADIEASRDQKTGAFGYIARTPDPEVKGGASRSLSCDVALYRGHKVGGKRLKEALNRFQSARAPISEVVAGARFSLQPGVKDHHDRSREYIAPYYYLFGMYWASEALGELPAHKAVPYAHSLGRALVDTQRADGAWLDSYTYGGPSYGTASSMLTLKNVAEALRAAEAEKR